MARKKLSRRRSRKYSRKPSRKESRKRSRKSRKPSRKKSRKRSRKSRRRQRSRKPSRKKSSSNKKLLAKYKIKAYVIHCYKKKPSAKVQRLIKNLKKVGISASVYPCINYKSEWLNKDGTPNATFKSLYKNKYIDARANMFGVEHAIAMSHKLALHKIHSSKSCKYGLILEDDVVLHKNFDKLLDNMLTAITNHKSKRIRNFGLFYLWNSNAANTRSKLKKVINDPLIMEETMQHNGGGVAYMVSKEFAKLEMRRPFPIKDTSDVHNGYVAFKRYHRRMAFLSIKMKHNEEAKKCLRKLPRIIRARWYDDDCITSPLVHTNWYENSSSHGDGEDDDFTLQDDWEYFSLLQRGKKTKVPKKYIIK